MDPSVFADLDATTVLAIGGFVLGLASGIAQIIKIIADTKRTKVQNKLDESAYAKNALEAANLATEARLKLEAHALELEKRIDSLAKTLERLESDLSSLDKKNKKLIRIVNELLDGIELLVKQLEKMKVEPTWVPSDSIHEVIKESMARQKPEQGD